MKDEQLTLSALFKPGAAYFPEDFPRRLDGFKKASGLSWRGLSYALGVDIRQIQRWRKGVEPTGGSMLSLFHLARFVPQGPDYLLNSSPPAKRR